MWNHPTFITIWHPFWQRYRWHYGFALFGFISLLILEERPTSVPLSLWQTVLWQGFNIASLAVILTVVHALLRQYASQWMRQYFWWGHVVTILLSNLLAVGFDYAMDSMGLGLDLFKDTNASGNNPFWLVFWLEYWSDLKYAIFFWVCAEVIYTKIPSLQPPTSPNEPPLLSPVSGFLDKIPTAYHNGIDVIEAQQNYIKIYVADKQFMVLYRFGKAVEELGDNDGLKIHRSFWVSYATMTGLEQTGQHCFILTKNGMKVPVSRSFREKVKNLDLPKIT